MLGKLLKHEFHATGRVMWVIYVAMLGLSVMGRLALKGLDMVDVWPQPVRAMMMLVLVAWVLSLVIGGVATVVLLVKRFHKNLLTDEGYLMFTLPCSVHHLVIAKIIAAAVWTVATICVIALSMLIALVGEEILIGVRAMIGFVFYGSFTALDAINGVTIILEIIILMLLGSAGSCLQFYSAMSIGHGFTSHKVLWSVVVYFIQNIVLQILSVVLVVTPLSYVGEHLTSPNWLDTISPVQAWHMGVLGICAMEVIVGAVFYILTVVNLQKRLNLA